MNEQLKDAVPFSIEKWQQGWKPVTRDKWDKATKGLKLVESPDGIYRLKSDSGYSWDINGRFLPQIPSILDLFLLPPEDIVVEVVDDFIVRYPNGKRPKPGRYKLVKID